MSSDQILREALALSAEEKAQLAERLLASLDGPEQAEIDAAWAEEVERRIDAYKAREEAARPAAEVIEEMRQRLSARSMKALMLAAAQAELADAISYYESRERGLGERFLSEIEVCIGQIETMPNAWPKVSKRSRRCRLRHFPYGLMYQIVDERAVILAVAHLRRKPGYWRNRERN